MKRVDETNGNQSQKPILDQMESEISRLVTRAAIQSPSRDDIDGMITQFRDQFKDVAVMDLKNIEEHVRILRTRLEAFMDRNPGQIHETNDVCANDLVQNKRNWKRSAIKADNTLPDFSELMGYRAIARWIEEHADNLTGLDARMIAGLAINNLKKELRAALSVNDKDVLLRYVQSLMTIHGIPSPTQKSVAQFPGKIERKLEGITLNEKERRALLYLLTNATMNESAKPEAVGIAAGEIEFDDSKARECPLCVLTLRDKLQDTQFAIEIEITHGKIYRGSKRQGYRVLSISLGKQK